MFLPSGFILQKRHAQGIVPNNLLYSFYVGAAVLIGCIVWTVVSTKEYPPDEFASFHEPEEKEEKHQNGLLEIFSDLAHMPKTMKQLGVVQFFSWFALFSMWVFTTPAIAEHVYHIKARRYDLSRI